MHENINTMHKKVCAKCLLVFIGFYDNFGSFDNSFPEPPSDTGSGENDAGGSESL